MSSGLLRAVRRQTATRETGSDIRHRPVSGEGSVYPGDLVCILVTSHLTCQGVSRRTDGIRQVFRPSPNIRTGPEGSGQIAEQDLICRCAGAPLTRRSHPAINEVSGAGLYVRRRDADAGQGIPADLDHRFSNPLPGSLALFPIPREMGNG